MAFAPNYDPPAVYLPDPRQTMVKALIAGGFGVGKTTMIGSLSEIPPLHTEEVMTAAGATVDQLAGLSEKTTTTVGLDFGRYTLPAEDLVLYLFGTPGQERFRALWEDLAAQALGAVVLIDTRRIQDAFWVMEAVEQRNVPYVVAVNAFAESPRYPVDELRDALDLEPTTPLLSCDARDTTSCLQVLIALVQHLLTHYT